MYYIYIEEVDLMWPPSYSQKIMSNEEFLHFIFIGINSGGSKQVIKNADYLKEETFLRFWNFS